MPPLIPRCHHDWGVLRERDTPRQSMIFPKPWGHVMADIADLFLSLARKLDRPLPEFLLGEILALGRRECFVSVSREGICVEGMPWSWSEWLAFGEDS